MTKTRNTDSNGNVYYTISEGDRQIGRIDKTCSGYQVTLADGSYIPVGSIKRGMEVLAK